MGTSFTPVSVAVIKCIKHEDRGEDIPLRECGTVDRDSDSDDDDDNDADDDDDDEGNDAEDSQDMVPCNNQDTFLKRFWSCDFLQGYLQRNDTEPKVPANSGPSALIFIIYNNDNNKHAHLLRLFANIVRSLPGVRVRLDRECREQNQRHVKAWADVMLSLCSRVVVVLSDGLVRVCRSYRESRRLELESPSAYTDVTPHVLQRLAVGHGSLRFEQAVFVHFGYTGAQQDYDHLLRLYRSPHALQGERSTVIDCGQPESTPTRLMSGETEGEGQFPEVRGLGGPCRGLDIALSDSRGKLGPATPGLPALPNSTTLSGAESVYQTEEGQHIPPPAYSSIQSHEGALVCPDYAGTAEGSGGTGTDRLGEGSHNRCPDSGFHGTGHVQRGQTFSPRCRHKSAPQPSTCFFLADESRRPTNQSYPSSPRGRPLAWQWHGGFPNTPSSVPEYSCLEPISLQTTQGLGVFLLQICPDKRVVENVCAGEAVKEFYDALQTPCLDQHPMRVPQEHSCHWSRVASSNSLATETDSSSIILPTVCISDDSETTLNRIQTLK